MLWAPERARYDGNLKIEWLIQNRVDVECLTSLHTLQSSIKISIKLANCKDKVTTDTLRLFRKKKKDRCLVLVFPFDCSVTVVSSSDKYTMENCCCTRPSCGRN